jgi:hypothetical protein
MRSQIRSDKQFIGSERLSNPDQDPGVFLYEKGTGPEDQFL